MNAQVTSISDLQRYAQGTIVEFPAFADGQPLVARIKRPSLLALMSKGKIPNSLKVKVNELFQVGGSALDVDDEEMLNDLYDILEIFAEASLIEPTLSDIKEAGLELTDEQLMFIFTYSQGGIKALESFREEQGDTESNINVQGIQPKTE
jgi:hypothetical protein